MSNTKGNYDIIGDIHGHASTLILLLKTLGYKKDESGVFSHKERKVIFLGDFIDRGKEESLVIDTVKPMIDHGHALSVMGNHEFNAVCYHTNHPQTDKPLREHSARNQKTHQAFLNEYPVGDNKTIDLINWFRTLPLFIELNEFRVIHACWHDETIKRIKPQLNSNHTLPDELFVKGSQAGSVEYDIFETLLKGIEIPLPDGFQFLDKDGNVRTETRVKWWKQGAKTYRDYAQVPDSELHNIPDTILPKTLINPEYSDTNKPVFIGHYWFSGVPKILKKNVACLDYSVANKEKLVCYRWNKGDSKLTNSQFVQVDCVENTNDLQ